MVDVHSSPEALPKQRSWRARLAQALSLRLRLLLVSTCALSLPSYVFGDWHWVELSCHFRPHCFIALVFGSLWLLSVRRWGWLALVLPTCLLLGTSILPWYLPRAESLPQGAECNLRLLLANVLSSNLEHHLILDLVEMERPDVLVLLEVNHAWIESLSVLKEEYPFYHEVPRPDNFGIAVYSRLPLMNLHMTEFGWDLPSIVGILELNGRRVDLVATHPLPPLSAKYFHLRNRQLGRLPAAFSVGSIGSVVAGSSSSSAILIGDLNLTMWSNYHARLEEESGLRNVRRGKGILPTWPVGLGPARIPLDHCLVSPEILVAELRAGPDVGGDHLPLIVDLFIPPTTSD
jgi:endonuclease/exonuclease/phosphatase (EEP) superfamily protein YafD